MKPGNSEKRLRKLLERAMDQTVATTVEVMLDFYANERARGCPIDEDGDMLLYQWGTYDWGEGEHFSLGITRQFIRKGDDEPSQLNLTVKFEPTGDCRSLGENNHWCHSPNQIAVFRKAIQESAPYLLLRTRVPSQTNITFSDA